MTSTASVVPVVEVSDGPHLNGVSLANQEAEQYDDHPKFKL